MIISRSFPIPKEGFAARLEAAAQQAKKRVLYITYTLIPSDIDSEAGVATFEVIMRIPVFMSILRPFTMIGNGDRYCNIVFSYSSQSDGSTICSAEAIDWELSTWDNKLNHKTVIKPLIEKMFDLIPTIL